MLFWTAVINGVLAVPIMVAMMLVVSSGQGLRTLSLPRWLRLLGWLDAALMALAVGLLIWSSFGQEAVSISSTDPPGMPAFSPIV
jgi:Mn2+/Fe2+ NRAMP family transporter